MPHTLPAYLAAAALTIYWGYVLIKLYRLGRKLGKDPNAMPRERVGQLMRLLWYPCILLLLLGLWLAAAYEPLPLSAHPQGFSLLRAWIIEPSSMWYGVAIPATLICLICTIFTFVCWRKMGRSWRIGIDPNEKLDLVSTGPYRYVRHPIYALRMVINICAFLMAPTLLVLAAGAIDFVLLQIEARREERYMESKHPQEYARYKNSVGRFVPRAFVV